MPAPGNKRHKSKRGRPANTARDLSSVDIPTVLDAYVEEINDTRDWEGVVRVLCRMFDLPDMHTRSGLKKIHANFNDIQQKLEAAFSKYEGNEKVMGGIVGIWARMCADSILRNKLFQGGLLNRMMPLLDTRSTRFIGLQALSTVTHHGGTEIRCEIATYTPKLLQLLEEFPEDDQLNELIINTLDHAVCAIITDEEASPEAIRPLDMPRVLQFTLSSIRRPAATHRMLGHALDLLAMSTLNCPREVKAIPSIVNLHVACLRSDDLTTRSSGLGAILRLTWKESEPYTAFHDPQKLIASVQRGFPSHLSRVLMAYDPKRCDTFLTMQCTAQHQKAIRRCIEDHDLITLGRTLAQLVVTTEYSVTEGGYTAVNPLTGQEEIADIGLPFKMFSDALQVCANALRETGNPKDGDLADIIELKFFISRQRIPDALELAERAITRNPQVAYYYYALSLCSDGTQGLKACKKGLKCKEITPFVRSYLLWRAVEHAGNLCITKLCMANPGDSAYAEGIAFMKSALDDAKAFIVETSPDNRHMPTMLNWHIVLTIALRGEELNLDLRELDDDFKKLEITKEFNKFFGTRQQNTQLKLTRELVLTRYKDAWKEWNAFITRFDAMRSTHTAQERGELKAGDNLSAWLAGLHVGGDEEEDHHCMHSAVGPNAVILYHCSYCNNPSAILRKCGGCGKTRYCDSSCQKMHWSEHKTACKQTQTRSPQEDSYI